MDVKVLENRLYKLSRELPPQLRARFDNELTLGTKQMFLAWYFGTEKYNSYVHKF